MEQALHRVQVRSAAAAVGAQALIEQRLGTTVQVTQDGQDGDVWALLFLADADVSLHFLRPHILPPERGG